MDTAAATQIKAEDLPLRGPRVIAEILKDTIRHPGYTNQAMMVGEYGASVRIIEKGGFWNDTTGRCEHGITKADAALTAQCLRAKGIRVRIEEADQILIKAAWGIGTGESPEEKREVYKSKTQIARHKARNAAKCIMCFKSECKEKRTTCYECGVRADTKRKAKAEKALAISATVVSVTDDIDDSTDF